MVVANGTWVLALELVAATKFPSENEVFDNAGCAELNVEKLFVQVSVD